MYLAYTHEDCKCSEETELLEQYDDESGLVDEGERGLDEQDDEQRGLDEQDGEGDEAGIGLTRCGHLSSLNKFIMNRNNKRRRKNIHSLSSGLR